MAALDSGIPDYANGQLTAHPACVTITPRAPVSAVLSGGPTGVGFVTEPMKQKP